MKTTQRIHRSPTQWREIFIQFEASRLSATAFCQQQGISYGSFMRWRQRIGSRGPDTSEASDDDWLPIEVATDAPGDHRATNGWDIELALPGGIQLRMRAR